MLDGAIKLKDLVKRTAGMGMSSVALTDHHNMFGAISFYKMAKDAGLKAIFGAELDVVNARGNICHMPVLASSTEGYKNLVKLISVGHVTPRAEGRVAVSLDDLRTHAPGLIAMTGCMGGLYAQSVLEEGVEAGQNTLAMLRETFGAENLYVELQDHGLPEQPVLNGIASDLARKLGLKTVATNDVHYAESSDADAHLVLSCIKRGLSHTEGKERHHGSREMFLKSPDMMAQLFRHQPEAIKSTLEIAERIAFKPKLGEPMLPAFKVPEGFDEPGYFRHVAREGLAARFGDFSRAGKSVNEGEYKARLELELDVICGMKFPGYFLIVWDFIRFAKDNQIPVGPGRGSGAGSLVAYSMRITDLDPIPYNLLFERFLNPERVSMPDFDIDFCMDKRDGVIRYVQQKYGAESVGQIATFAELKAKSVIKDVGRVMGILPMDTQAIANLIPSKTPAETYTIKESLEIEPKLKARAQIEPRIAELLEKAQKLEGLTRHAGKHAAGIVISEGPLWDHVPIFKDEREGSYVTQYYKDDVEAAGLVKFDFLGLTTLTVIDIAERLVNARPDISKLTSEGRPKFSVTDLPLNDAKTYQLLATGETKGVFQLESTGMQGLFKKLRADSFEDIVAAVALYRPGPLASGMVDTFVDCKHRRKPIEKMHALIDELLAPTYGVIVYQEQVMQIAQKLAGYTLGGADMLRRAMGKKKPEEMAKQKSTFVDGCKANGVSEEDAERIFGLLEYFAGYGFNKSHSAAYALITYQTAYLKAHYPTELSCAILSTIKDRTDKVVRTVGDARDMGIVVLPPDVNESDLDFKVVYTHPNGGKKQKKSERVQDVFGPQIRFGLGAVRGVGENAVESMFEARESGGTFADLFDFAERVDAKRVNKGVFEALVQCGAFDSTFRTGQHRAAVFASLDTAQERSRAASRDRERGQTSLFSMFDAAPASTAASSPSTSVFAQTERWDRITTLRREKEALGFYISGHPLDRYLKSGGNALAKVGAQPVISCHQADDWSLVRVVGMVEGYRERVFKDGGGKIAFFDLEDLSGRISVKVRGGAIENYAAILAKGEPVLVVGKVNFPRKDEDEAPDPEEAPREATLLLNEAVPLLDVLASQVSRIGVRLAADKTTDAELMGMAHAFEAHAGNCPVSLDLDLGDGTIVEMDVGMRVEIGDGMFAALERVFGEQVADLR